MTTAILSGSDDTFIVSTNTDANYGTSTIVSLGEINTTASIRRALVKFDLSSLPANAIISSATLRLYASADLSSNVATFSVYRQKRAWTTLGVTWDKYDGTNSWATAGGFGSDDCEQTAIGSRSMSASETLSEWKEWELDEDKVQEMQNGTFTNNGFLIKSTSENNDGYSFRSYDYDPDLGPELEIEYVLGGRNFQVCLIG